MERMTIIPADKIVWIDGVERRELEFSIEPHIHAVQWNGEYGEIEFASRFDGNSIVKPANEFFTDPSRFQSAIDAWYAWVPPEPLPIPNGTLIE